METEHDKLLKLYELSINEHQFYLETHHKRVDFYSGLVSALLTGTAIAVFQASQWYHYLYLCTAPILIFAVSGIAIQGTFRAYQSWIDNITVRAKIEQKLGLTGNRAESDDAPDSYWQSEPLIPQRYLKNRRGSESSEKFVKEYSRKGLQLWARRLFIGFQCLSVGLFVLLLSLAIWNYHIDP